MNIPSYHSQFRIADPDALIDRLIDEARADKLVREFVHNSVTAAAKLPSPAAVEITALNFGGVPKLAFWNESDPLDRKNAERLLGELSSSGQIIDVTGKLNFGVGAKLTGLKFNPHGLVYWVCAAGDAFEIKLARIPENGKLVYRPSRPRDLTTAELKACGRAKTNNWVMAILMGEDAKHDTVLQPFGRQTKAKPGWLQNELLRRYYTLPSKVKVRLATTGATTPVVFASLRAHVLKLQDMAKPPQGFTPGVSGARQTVGPIALPGLVRRVTAKIEYVWSGSASTPLGVGLTLAGKSVPSIEIYDAKFGDKWARKALSFGVFNGAYKKTMMLVHLDDPDDELAVETNREFIRLKSGEHLNSDEFADCAVKHMPKWLSDLVQVTASTSTTNRSAAFFDKLVQKHKLTTDVWRKAKQGQQVAPGNVVQFHPRTGPVNPNPNPNPNPTPGPAKKPSLQPLNNAPQTAQPVPRPLASPMAQWPDATTIDSYGFAHIVGVFVRPSNILVMNERHPQYVEFMEKVAQRCVPVPKAFVEGEYRIVAEEAAIAAVIAALLLANKGLATMKQVDDMTGPPAAGRHDGMALTAAILATLDANEDQTVKRISKAAQTSSQRAAATAVTATNLKVSGGGTP